MKSNLAKRPFSYYGIVEGFFSFPLPVWSKEERLNTLKFIKEKAKRLNIYLYCPKDDPYVTKKWDKLYPDLEATILGQTITYCQKIKMQFLYGLNPALPLSFNRTKEKIKLREKILNKLEQLCKLGCKSFCLLFDDIPFAYDVIENQQEMGKLTGQIIVSLANNVYQKLKEKIGELWLCPPDYCFKKKTPFTNQLKKLNPKIPLIWTGNDVFVQNIFLSDIRRIKKILSPKRKIIWWSNYPVNDCEQNIGTFNLGGFNGPNKKVLQELYGIMVNPMRECYANSPFYLTFSDYIYNPEGYNKVKSWQDALKQLIGNGYQSYEFIFKEFSARNLIDSQPKYLYQKLRKTRTTTKVEKLIKQTSFKSGTLKKSPPTTSWGKLFLNAVLPVIKDGQTFLAFAKKILSSTKLDEEKFSRFDRFPTTSLPRYYPEILKIVKARLSLLPNQLKNRPKSKLFTLAQLNEKFQQKYRGEKKLKITKTDSSRLKKAIRGSVNLERKLLIEILNGKKLKPASKIKILSLRQNLNRFTINWINHSNQSWRG